MTTKKNTNPHHLSRGSLEDHRAVMRELYIEAKKRHGFWLQDAASCKLCQVFEKAKYLLEEK